MSAIDHGPTTTGPLRLKPPVAWFTDRARALDRLYAEVTATVEAPVVLLRGPAGVGKTALANQLCRRALGDFPDGICHLDLAAEGCLRDGAVLWPEVVDKLLAWQRIEPASHGGYFDRRSVLHERLATRRTLIVLDGVRADPELGELLPPSGPSATVLLGREPADRWVDLVARGVLPIELSRLSPAHCRCIGRKMYRAFDLPADTGVLTALDPGAAGGLFTVVRAVAAHIAAQPRPLPADSDNLVADLLPQLAPERRRVLATALAHPGEWLGAELLPAADRDVLADLADRGVLTDLGDQQYQPSGMTTDDRLHALQDNGFSDVSELLLPIVQRYLALAHRADELLLGDRLRLPDLAVRAGEPDDVPFDSPGAASAWLERHRPNIEVVQEQAARLGWHRQVCDLAETMWACYNRRPRFAGAVGVYRRGVESAMRLSDRWAEAKLRAELSRSLAEAGRPDDAREQLRRLWPATAGSGDWRLGAMAYEMTGHQHQAEREYDRAEAAYQSARAAYRDHVDRRGEAIVLRGMALCRARAGDPPSGVRLAQLAVDRADAADESNWRGRTRLGLAEVELAGGRLDEARRAAYAATVLFTEQADWVHAASGCELQATIERRRGDRDAERGLLRQAIAAHDRAGNELIGLLVDRLSELTPP